MTTAQPKAPRKLPQQRLPLDLQIAHEYCMSVLNSTAAFDILDQKDGKHTARLIHLGREYSSKLLAGRA